MHSQNILCSHLVQIKALKAASISLSKLAGFIIIVGIALLSLVILSSCGGSPNPCNSCNIGSSPTPTIASATVGTTPTALPANGSPLVFGSALSTLKIEVDIPPLQVNQQTLIRVSLFPTGGKIPVSHVNIIPNSTVSVSQATPVGTPGNTLNEAFGNNNVVKASATLETDSNVFTIDPSGSIEKPLDLERVTWDWYITPLIPGKQVIGVYIEVTWQSKTGGQPSPPYTIGDSILQVNVGTPFSINFQLMLTILGTIIVPLTVALIAVPGFRRWVIKLFRGKKPQTRRKKPKSVQNQV